MRSMLECINQLLVTYDNRTRIGNNSKKQFDTRTTSEIIRGLSLMSHHLRDYAPTFYDFHLGKVLIGELNIESLPLELANQQLFPKESFFALSIGSAALQLKALTNSPSPIFTINTDNKIQWLDKLNSDSSKPNIIAGVVDIIDGQPLNIVKSANLANLLRAIILFYQATDSIELTKSSRLLEKNSKGKPYLTTILESRNDIRNLILGISNFLSSEIRRVDGAVLHSMQIKETIFSDSDFIDLEDQNTSIQALLDSYELFKNEIYLWSAIDIFYAMNHSLWNPRINFYFANSDHKPVSFSQKVAVLVTLARIKALLPFESRDQIDRILNSNLKPLK